MTERGYDGAMNTAHIAKEFENAVARISPSIRIDAQPDPLIERTLLVRVHELEALDIVRFILENASQPQPVPAGQGQLW